MTFYQNELEDRTRPIPPGYELTETRQPPRKIEISAQFEIGIYQGEPETIAAPGVLAIVTKRFEALLNDPGERYFFTTRDAGILPTKCAVENGIVFDGNEFYEVPGVVDDFEDPEELILYATRLRRPAVVDRNELWLRMEALLETFEASEIEAAFGTGEALQAIRTAARLKISDHFHGKTPRQQASYLDRTARAEIVGSYNADDLGAMAEKIYLDEAGKATGAAGVADLFSLVSSLTMIK